MWTLLYASLGMLLQSSMFFLENLKDFMGEICYGGGVIRLSGVEVCMQWLM